MNILVTHHVVEFDNRHRLWIYHVSTLTGYEIEAQFSATKNKINYYYKFLQFFYQISQILEIIKKQI